MEIRSNLELIRLRKQHAWSQEELAGKLGTTQANLSRWERGVTTPTPHYSRKLCELFQKSPEELFSDISIADAHTAFRYNMALTDAREFYGREREKLRLLSRTRKGESTSIVGPRRIGKTWLLHYLRLIAPTELGTQFIVGYLDATAPSCATLSGFTTEILTAFSIPTPSDTSSSANLIALQTGIKELKQRGQFPILCVDEFEGLCKIPDFHLEFLERLRAVAQESLGLVLASKRPLIDIALDIGGDDGQTSPFFNIFMQILLKPFSLQEATTFIQAKSREAMFTEQERNCLLRYGKQSDQELWPPLRLQLVGTLLQEDKLLAAQGALDPRHPDYWQEFEKQVEEAYKGAVR